MINFGIVGVGWAGAWVVVGVVVGAEGEGGVKPSSSSVPAAAFTATTAILNNCHRALRAVLLLFSETLCVEVSYYRVRVRVREGKGRGGGCE